MSRRSQLPNVGRYELLDVLGQGSTGVVFEARPAGDGAQPKPETGVNGARSAAPPAVVLKLVHPRCGDAFERELRALTALAGNAGVPRLLESGICRHGSYLVTENVGGRSLEQWLLCCGPTPPVLLVELADRLLAVIRSIHTAGWVHADVKPANVLLGSGRRPVLVDFGDASVQPHRPSEWRRRPDASRRPVTGTTAHLAPEMLAGGRSTPAGDLYGAGSTLWTLLDGSPPFGSGYGAADHALAQHILDQPPPDPAGLGAPAPLRDLVVGLLDKQPERRGMAVARYGSR